MTTKNILATASISLVLLSAAPQNAHAITWQDVTNFFSSFLQCFTGTMKIIEDTERVIGDIQRNNYNNLGADLKAEFNDIQRFGGIITRSSRLPNQMQEF